MTHARGTADRASADAALAGSRVKAVLEVAAAFAVMHVAFRAFKRFTPWGQWEYAHDVNLSPGVAMVVVSLGCLALRRRPPATAGLTARPFFAPVNAAFVCLGILAAAVGILTMAGVPLFASKTAWPEALTVAAAGLVATAALLWTLRRLGSGAGGPLDRVPKGLTLLLLAAALAAPVAVVVSQGQPLGYEAWKMLELALAAGVSEEIFFRGYAQSRLNEAFGRPWRLLGVPFGPGLLLASAFFGLIHAANPADYFLGVYQFAWPHALTTAAALYYGFLRERTGGVLAPAVVHAVTDIGARMMFVRVIS